MSCVFWSNLYGQYGVDFQKAMTFSLTQSEYKSKQIISPAPEAAELGKYGNTPVSLFTGTPKISIPLYELKGNSLSLPISLSFNASGFKPQEAPTWVGQNWSLNAGGVITRSVRGNPDDQEHYSVDDLSTDDFVEKQDILQKIRKGEIEMDPDLYFYNFGNYAGKFLVTPFMSVFKKEEDMLVISPTCIFCKSALDRSYVTIVDDKGNIYTFGDVEVSSMSRQPEEGPDPVTVRSYKYASSWYLTSIVSADGHEKILFEYYTTAEGRIDLPNNNNTSVTRTYSSYKPVSSNNPPTEDGFINGSYPPDVKGTRKYLKKATLSRDGQTIAYIDFISAMDREDGYLPESRRLQRLDIYDASDASPKLVKQFELTHGYYTNVNNTYMQKRLRLDKVQEKSVKPGVTSPPPYQFEYYYNDYDRMPDQYNKALDHWGFYNYQTGNISLVPSVEISIQKPPYKTTIGQDANRNPDLSGSVLGMISKMTYPTGGYTTYLYELHNAMKSNGSIRELGGVRIKTLTDYAANGQQATVKNYLYQLENGKTSGKSDDYYPKYLTKGYYYYNGGGNISGPYVSESTSYTVAANAIYGLGTFQGGHIGYSRVTESLTNLYGGQPLGKTVYKYHMGVANEFDEDIANGDLDTMQLYDAMGKLQFEQANTYKTTTIYSFPSVQAKPLETQTSRVLFCRKTQPDGSVLEDWFDALDGPQAGWTTVRRYETRMYVSSYDFKVQKKALEKQVTKTYDQLSGNYIVNTTLNSFENNAHIYPTKIEQFTAGGEEVVTKKKYVADYNSNNPNDGGISWMKTKNVMGAEIESYQYRQLPDGQQKRIVGGIITQYDTNLQPEKIFRLETGSPLTSYQESAVTANGFVMDPAYKPLAKYSYANGVITSQEKVNDITTSYIWNSNNSYPIAEITNSGSSSVAYSSFEQSGDANSGWRFTNVPFDNTNAYTGKRSAILATGGSIDRVLSAPAAKPLIVSFWLQQGNITLLKDNQSLSPVISGPLRKGWTYYEYNLPAGTQNINIRSTNAVLDELRCYPADAQMTTYTYEPLVGMTSQTSANNLTTTYEYDGLNRLAIVKDEQGNIRQQVAYNYGPGSPITVPATLFYNAEKSQSFTKNDCTRGEPTTHRYVVSYGKYASGISQQDADNKALEDIAREGQNYANRIGECLFYNAPVSRILRKNDCPPELGFGSLVNYLVEARKWSSPIDKAAADALAQKDLNDNAQAYANARGTCTCEGEDKRMVNGVCERGVKTYLTSLMEANGKYKCTYVYVFSNGNGPVYTEYSSTPCPVL